MKGIGLVWALLLVVFQVCAQTPNLMPLPARYLMQTSRYNIQTQFSISIAGNADGRIYAEASRFYQRLAERTGIFFPTWRVGPSANPIRNGLQIAVQRKGRLELGEDESYRLQVSDSVIRIQSNTDIGAIRAMETLLQLLESDAKGYFFRGADIEDAPRFPWRGLLISQPYHFMPMDVIKRTLDAMAAVKMNVFHFYISDDQGYRIESKVYPRLHQLASDGQYFTHAQVKEMIDYAYQRGIRVIPEIDLPGHSTAILYAYPHLASIKRAYALQDHWGVFDPVMDPTKEPTYIFLDSLLTEVAALFPDTYFHIGGDENTGRDWQRNPAIVEFMKERGFASTLALQNYFNRRVMAILKKSGKKVIGWDEVLMRELDDSTAKKYFEQDNFAQLIESNVPKDLVIQSWRGMEALISSARNGYKSILSKGYYIDLVQPASYHYLTDPIPYRNSSIIPDSEANLNRFESKIIEKIRKGNRLLTEEQEKLILGGEATMWTEHVTHETIDSRIWPRTAAIAERLWSSPEVRDVEDMYRRMDIISVQLESLGCTHIKNTAMLLRRLANQQEINCLSEVVQYLEPVQGYQRNQQNNFTRFSPYSLLADIAVPDQKAVRDLRKKCNVAAQATDTIWKKEFRLLFRQWIENDYKVQQLSSGIPALADLAKCSNQLHELAIAALTILNTSSVSPAMIQEMQKKIATSRYSSWVL